MWFLCRRNKLIQYPGYARCPVQYRARLCHPRRLFPLPDLLKTGMEEENSCSLYKILSCGPNLFTTFVIWLSASASIERTWSSGLIWFTPIKLRKICHSTYLLRYLFCWKSKGFGVHRDIFHNHQIASWIINRRNKNHPHNPRNTRYKITIFLSRQHSLKWKSRVKRW